MPDIFLSYSREDQVVAKRFAQGFEQERLSVWWDQTLNPGEAYDKVTEKALEEAKAVVVLWSKKSVDSRWVRSEATQANTTGTLVPVMIEACKRPVMFELTHTADLSGWKGDINDPAWQSLLSGVRRFVNKESSAVLPAPALTSSAASSVQINARALGILAGVLLAAAGAYWAINRLSANASSTQSAADSQAVATRASVAVMPFSNLTGDPSKDYLGEGMAEELINLLTKVPGLTVPSRTSSFSYRGRNADMKQIAKDLNVDTILEGSVRSAGETIRITAQLIDAQTDRHIWSQTYDRKYTDLFQLQDDLAHEIVAAFKTSMHADLPDFISQAPPSKNIEAYGLYLQAASLIANGNSDQTIRKGIELLEAAVALDPDFANAYLLMATARGLAGAPIADIERDARKAVSLDPGLPEFALATVFADVEAKRGNWRAAEEIYRAGMPDSRDPGVHLGYVVSVLLTTGQLRKALQEGELAKHLAPAMASGDLTIAFIQVPMGLYAEAASHIDLAIEHGVDKTGRRVRQVHAAIAANKGRFAEAADHLTATLSADVRASGGTDVVRLVYSAMDEPKRKPDAVIALNGLIPKLKPEDWIVKAWAMSWYTRLGELDRAFDVADQLRVQFARQNPTAVWWWLWLPEMASFRRDPRFQDLAKRLGLMAYWTQYGPPDACDLQDGKIICH